MSELLKGLAGIVLKRFKKENLNPKETPSTAVAYTGAAAIASLQMYPQTEQDAVIQLVLAAISAYYFWIDKKK